MIARRIKEYFSWKPNHLEGLYLWLDASDESTVHYDKDMKVLRFDSKHKPPLWLRVWRFFRRREK